MKYIRATLERVCPSGQMNLVNGPRRLLRAQIARVLLRVWNPTFKLITVDMNNLYKSFRRRNLSCWGERGVDCRCLSWTGLVCWLADSLFNVFTGRLLRVIGHMVNRKNTTAVVWLRDNHNSAMDAHMAFPGEAPTVKAVTISSTSNKSEEVVSDTRTASCNSIGYIYTSLWIEVRGCRIFWPAVRFTLSV